MNAEEIQQFRAKLAQAQFEEHFEAGEDPEYTWIENWDDGKCLSVKCFRRGKEVPATERLADQADRAKKAALIADKDIPTELKIGR